MPLLAPIAGAVVGGLFQSSAANRASAAQQASDAARLAEEKRVREQLRVDTANQRAIADKAFQDYQRGLISYADAQQRASNAYANVQQSIGESQLSDTAKAMEMAQFTPYSIRTGSGRTFFDQDKGVAGYALSPELQAMQQQAYGGAQGLLGNLPTGLTPQQQAYQQMAYGGSLGALRGMQTGLTPEQQAYQQQAYGAAGRALGAISATPQEAAQQYYQQQQGLLEPQRQAEDIALRQEQLSRGRLGLGISSEAAGAGAGGYVNPEQFQRDRARALANAQIAAQATQAGQQQQANQLALAQGLFGQGAAGTAQQQQQAANQAALAQNLFGQGAAGVTQQQQQLANQIQASQGLYNLGQAPEEFGMRALGTGLQYGQQAQQARQNLANLYAGGMSDYYKSMLGAGGTLQQAGLFAPQAAQTAANEAYQRQQTYLGALQGSQLPYQAMTTPQAMVPGSAYAMAGLGSGLMSAGMQGIRNYMNTPSVIDGGYSMGVGSAYGGTINPAGQFVPYRQGM